MKKKKLISKKRRLAIKSAFKWCLRLPVALPILALILISTFGIINRSTLFNGVPEPQSPSPKAKETVYDTPAKIKTPESTDSKTATGNTKKEPQSGPAGSTQKHSPSAPQGEEDSEDNKPFRITSVRLQDAYAGCNSGSYFITVYTVAFASNNIKGGKFTWKFEAKSDVDAAANSIYHNNTGIDWLRYGQMKKGDVYMYIEGGDSWGPGPLLSFRASLRPPDAVRAHVISPNSIASPWLRITDTEAARCN